MLTRLHISNYALIDELVLNPTKGMTVITGETGAGKSILLGALSLILGARSDSNALISGKKKCVIEAEFDLTGYDISSFFQSHDLDFSLSSIIRRELSHDGKSRAFINDTPVNLTTLKELGSQLIDIHSQHETLTINESNFQMQVVDSLADCVMKLKTYSNAFLDFKKKSNELSALRDQSAQRQTESDYNQFLLQELEAAQLVAGEMESLEQEQQMLEGAEGFQLAIANALSALNQEPIDIQGIIHKMIQNLGPLTAVYPFAAEWVQRLKSVGIELKDLAGEMERGSEQVSFNPERLNSINERTDLLNRLMRKHRVDKVSDLIEIRNRLSSSLNGNEELILRIKQLDSEVNKLLEQLTDTALAIRKSRSKAIPSIRKKVLELLKEVGLQNASFDINLEPLPQGTLRPNGADSVHFLFSANKGSALKPLDKVASGGELSRLMLCIKSLIAEKSGLPTLIFDEIDTGVSGEIAHKIGIVIREMSRGRQVFVITHLPQMAAHGTDHFFVSKKVVEGRTISNVVRLNKDQRVDELARLLSGELLTEAARANARELLGAHK
jgi:DNA repair protein RecN (Recombination protein N)